MKLTREDAIDLHRQMWTDMLKELGEGNPDDEYMLRNRYYFKCRWIDEHFPESEIENECFLCEFAKQEWLDNVYAKKMCDFCPIDWGGKGMDDRGFYCESGDVQWGISPISEILALPESKVE